jgi:plastocyanin
MLSLARRIAGWSLALVPVMAVALFVAAPAANAGGTCHEGPTAAKAVSVSLSGLCFGPTVTYVDPGGKVTWTNKDDIEHTVTGMGFRWGTGQNLLQGQSVTYKFDTAGVYGYECILHPGMVGTVVVGDAGSPSAVGLAAPVPVLSSAPPAAAAKAPAPVTVIRQSSSGILKTISAASLGLLAGALLTLGLGWQLGARRRATVVS